MLNLWDIEKLVDLYGDIVYGFCRRLAINKPNTDDLYQQTFLRAIELRDKIDTNNNPKGFLISIAVSIWKNDIRKKARHHRIAPIMDMEESAFLNISSDRIGTEEIALSNEIMAQVNIIVSNLNDRFRILIIMYYNVDMSIADISNALNIPQGTIKSRLHKARTVIKKELEVKGYEGY